MPTIDLKYGCNPNQTIARLSTDGPMPLSIVNGSPSYINILDGLRGWQLVRELKAATGKAAAASFKHVSPAGVAVAGELSDAFCQGFFFGGTGLSPVAQAYAKARSSDRVASFGDFVAVSEPVDESLAVLLKPEVSDGIIAPSFDPKAVEILSAKKRGGYVMLQMDPDFTPPATDTRRDFGITLEQSLNDSVIDKALLTGNIVSDNKTVPEELLETMIVTTIAIKHTQSNSIGVGYQGQAVGIGAGQQSRIACTRLACDKADRWLLKMHPKTLGLRFKDGLPKSEKVNAAEQFVRWHELSPTEKAETEASLAGPVTEEITEPERMEWIRSHQGVVLSSDAFIPFRDNLDRAAESSVCYVAQAGGSARDDVVIEAANEHGMILAFTGLRLFLH